MLQTLHAATQGNIGRNSSGSISISLHIPEYTRLVAEETTTLDHDEAQFCLHVIDSTTQAEVDFYRVSQQINKSAGANNQTVLLPLNNLYRSQRLNAAHCVDQAIISNKFSQTNNQAILFMLIAE